MTILNDNFKRWCALEAQFFLHLASEARNVQTTPCGTHDLQIFLIMD